MSIVFPDQPNPSQSQATGDAEDEEVENNPAQMFGVLVSVRNILKFLSSHVVSTTTIACAYPSFPYLS